MFACSQKATVTCVWKLSSCIALVRTASRSESSKSLRSCRACSAAHSHLNLDSSKTEAGPQLAVIGLVCRIQQPGTPFSCHAWSQAAREAQAVMAAQTATPLWHPSRPARSCLMKVGALFDRIRSTLRVPVATVRIKLDTGRTS